MKGDDKLMDSLPPSQLPAPLFCIKHTVGTAAGCRDGSLNCDQTSSDGEAATGETLALPDYDGTDWDKGEGETIIKYRFL